MDLLKVSLEVNTAKFESSSSSYEKAKLCVLNKVNNFIETNHISKGDILEYNSSSKSYNDIRYDYKVVMSYTMNKITNTRIY